VIGGVVIGGVMPVRWMALRIAKVWTPVARRLDGSESDRPGRVRTLTSVRAAVRRTTRNPDVRRLSLFIACLLTAGLAAAGGSLPVASAASPGTTVTLNSTGGTNATDGLKISYAGGQFMVWRDGKDQLYGGTPPASYNYNQVVLGVGTVGGGGTLLMPGVLLGNQTVAGGVSKVGWDTVTTTTAEGFTSVLTGVVNALTYTVTVDVEYTVPDLYFFVTYTVDVPAGNTDEIRLYHALDSYLEGFDQGAGFSAAGGTCANGGSYGQAIGVTSSTGATVEVLQYVSGAAWDGYYSGVYQEVVFSRDYSSNLVPWGQGSLAAYPDVIVTDPTTDNGYGVNWFFGTAPGSYTSTSKFAFDSERPDPCDGVPPGPAPEPPAPTPTPDPIPEPRFTG